MKIIGKFKDRYDYVSHSLGIDEKIVHDRNSYLKINHIFKKIPCPWDNVQFHIDNRIKKSDHYKLHKLVSLYFCGKIYGLEIPTNFKISDYTTIGNTYSLDFYDYSVFNTLRFKHSTFINQFINNKYDYDVVEASDEIKQFAFDNKLPYFIFDCYKVVNKFFPLSMIDDFFIKDNELLYTMIYNELISYTNPPTIEVSNKDKIIQAGFDLTHSFRK